MTVNLYHGSGNIIKTPQFGEGSRFNDYGLGFYTTLDPELAKEWAVPTAHSDGIVNKYEIDLTGLNVLDLDNEPFEHWISVLIQNRGGRFSRLTNEAMKKFIEKYPFSVTPYDVIKGYRADDSYFQFVRDFCQNGLSLEKLKTAIKLGNLGIQYCILSKKAFRRLKFIEPAEPVSAKKYNQSRIERYNSARQAYNELTDKQSGMLMVDIVGR
jgi:hypothetical protein